MFVFVFSSDETSFKAFPYQNAWVAIDKLHDDGLNDDGKGTSTENRTLTDNQLEMILLNTL